MTWDSLRGYMGPFYGEESFVLDIMLPTTMVEPFKQALPEQVQAGGRGAC